jgi:hypothetical protein
MFHPNIQDVVIPAVTTLNSMAGAPYNANALYSNWETLEPVRTGIAARWDAGEITGRSEAEWLHEKVAKLHALTSAKPPSRSAVASTPSRIAAQG